MHRCCKPLIVALLSMTVTAAELPATHEYVNSIGMKFIRIPAGTFKMGQLETPLPLEASVPGLDFLRVGDFDEQPVHTVTISKPFYMAVCEVTNFQYELFDSRHRALRGKEGLSVEDDEAVINVNWYDAMKFCR